MERIKTIKITTKGKTILLNEVEPSCKAPWEGISSFSGEHTPSEKKERRKKGRRKYFQSE